MKERGERSDCGEDTGEVCDCESEGEWVWDENRGSGGSGRTPRILPIVSRPLLGGTGGGSRARTGVGVGGRGERGGGEFSSGTATGDVAVPRCGTVDEKEVGGSGGRGGGRGRRGAIMSFELKWNCAARGSTGSARLRLRRRPPPCPLPLLALEGRTLLMRFTRPVTLARRRLLWLEDVRVGEIGEPSGVVAAAADAARRWGHRVREVGEAGVLDDVGVAVSIVVADRGGQIVTTPSLAPPAVRGVAESGSASLMDSSTSGGTCLASTSGGVRGMRCKIHRLCQDRRKKKNSRQKENTTGGTMAAASMELSELEECVRKETIYWSARLWAEAMGTRTRSIWRRSRFCFRYLRGHGGETTCLSRKNIRDREAEKPRPWGERPNEGTIGGKRKVGVKERGKVLMGSGDAQSLALMAQDEGRESEDANDVAPSLRATSNDWGAIRHSEPIVFEPFPLKRIVQGLSIMQETDPYTPNRRRDRCRDR